ncbi:hypothetical protein BD626DRAFT_629606 [Schizophyllum amplum]|uniref:Uncharacterized protein n=1 Tax=Schizophyllum amplum TaxID=97359 RepID=A0A550CG86_9AGAR|nr:hypothetical protein BD626DRAFT_629606 [Auriculariopsis ampla]
MSPPIYSAAAGSGAAQVQLTSQVPSNQNFYDHIVTPSRLPAALSPEVQPVALSQRDSPSRRTSPIVARRKRVEGPSATYSARQQLARARKAWKANVCEMVFSGLTPNARPVYVAILALALQRNYNQILNWFNNNRDHRTHQATVELEDPLTLRATRGAKYRVYPEMEDVARNMTIEQFAQLVEAERDRQMLLLGEDASMKVAPLLKK